MHTPIQSDNPAQMLVVPPLAMAAQALMHSGNTLMAVVAAIAAVGTLMGGIAGLSREFRAHADIRAARRAKAGRETAERALYASDPEA